MKCEKCHMEMLKLKKVWVCEECQLIIPIDENKEEVKKDWKYKEDGTRIQWIEEGELKKYPYIISHEYKRINTLIEDKQPYGAMMQLKDTYECLVKFWVLKECARIYAKKDKNDKEVLILKVLTEKLLLLSNWKNMLDEIKELPEINAQVKETMESLLFLLQGNLRVIDWRNRVIGHGALGYADNYNNRNEFHQILDGLTMHLRQYKDVYQNIEFGLQDGVRNEFCILQGCAIPPKIMEMEDSFEINSVVVRDGTFTISMYPFILWYKQDVFYFDSYSSDKKYTDIISYTLGEKETIRKQHPLFETCEKVAILHTICQEEGRKRDLRGLLKNENAFVENGAYLSEMEKWLLESYSMKDSIKTEYIQKWLQEKVKEKKGIYLFQAHAETGKTVAAMQLEGRINNGISLGNTTNKVIYINEANCQVGYILDKIQLAFTTGMGGENIIRQSNPLFILPTKGKERRKQQLANYLNGMRKKLMEVGRCAKKLLVVFDGVDELSDDELDFLEYIPRKEQLDEGIYILLISRTNEEMSSKKIYALNQIVFDDILVKQENDVDIEDMHRRYINKQLPVLSGHEQEVVYSLGKKSFLQIYLVTFMLKNQMLDISEIDDYQNTNMLVSKYLEYLKNLYSNIDIELLETVLYLLASDMQSRTLQSISYQIGEEQISFSLMGVLRDLRAILDVKHGIAKTFCINHDNKKNAIFSFLEKEAEVPVIEQNLIQTWTERFNCISYWSEEELLQYDNEEYTKHLEDMMEVFPEDVYFLHMFFNHPFSYKVGLWERMLDPKIFLFILEKFFAGPNDYLETKEWENASMQLADSIGDFLERQWGHISDEETKTLIRFMKQISYAFSLWRGWFSRQRWEGGISEFKNSTSVMHCIYQNVEKFYIDLKTMIEDEYRQNMPQSIYNFLILLENALLHMVDEFIDFSIEIDLHNQATFWTKKKSILVEESVKQYDSKMEKYVTFQKITSLYQRIRVMKKDSNLVEIKEISRKINELEKQLQLYDLSRFEALRLEREKMFSELISWEVEDVRTFEHIPMQVIEIAKQLSNVTKQQIDIVRQEKNEGKRSDEVSESVRIIADVCNGFVTMGMVINPEANLKSALKLSEIANDLYEQLSPRMQNYYLLQRVNVVGNYIMLLHRAGKKRERDKYLQWYIEQREEIMDLIHMRVGKICEEAEHGTWILDSLVAYCNHESVEDVHNKIFYTNYFEVHRNSENELRVRCKENCFSTKTQQAENGLRVKFFKKFCNKCQYVDCPAYKGIHEVVIEEPYDIIDDIL